jgi:lysophospholipase L1-like esterase
MTRPFITLGAVVAAGFLSLVSSRAESRPEWQFDFGPGKVQPGCTQVTKSSAYDEIKGFGFLDTSVVKDADRGGADALRGDFCTSDGPFIFAARVPEGNYDVTVVLGDAKETSSTTVKAETRRLMLEKVETAPGKFETRTFTVNVRTPEIKGGGRVSINQREKGPPLVGHWDDKLSIEFNGRRPCVCGVNITPAPDVPTVYLAGDSTVTDQPGEPYAGWGQMLPRFFKPGIAVANHAESGLALYSFQAQHRLEKILSTMCKGDWLFIQFGHNDQKDKSPGSGPFTTYKENLKRFVAAARAKGGNPVLVTSMERRRWSGNEPQLTLADFAEAARQVGREENVPVIDLHAMSLQFYRALGPQQSTRAFVQYPANTYPGQDKPLKDDTHHNAYGGYELARCIVDGIIKNLPELAKHLAADAKPFDPSHPDSPDSFDLPASVVMKTEKPAGN